MVKTSKKATKVAKKKTLSKASVKKQSPSVVKKTALPKKAQKKQEPKTLSAKKAISPKIAKPLKTMTPKKAQKKAVAAPKMLMCTKCKLPHPIDAFSKNAAATNRHQRAYWCKACTGKHAKAAYEAKNITRAKKESAVQQATLICGRCKDNKPDGDFHVCSVNNKRRQRAYWCKDCVSKYSKTANQKKTLNRVKTVKPKGIVTESIVVPKKVFVPRGRQPDCPVYLL